MTDYRSAGVDLNLGDSIKDHIAALIKRTHSASVVTRGGEFGGVFRVPNSNVLAVTSIDGVGTKLLVAIAAGIHDTVGKDLVNHSVNDIAVMGATPAFFVDYFAAGKLNENTVLEVIKGITAACSEHEMALVGGETAQMPDLYDENEYDLAGAITGFMSSEDPYLSRVVKSGDMIIGFKSNGLHTNGYSLARKIVFSDSNWEIDTHNEELGTTWGSELLKVHRSYLNIIRDLIDNHEACRIAHITGGGIPGNMSRVLPEGIAAKIEVDKIPRQPVFSVLERAGAVSHEEMYEVFNMGCGMLAVVPGKSVDNIVSKYEGDAFLCGSIISHEERDKVVLV